MKRKNVVLENMKKFWDFVWNGESFASWITFVVLAFIFIKFLFFPALAFVTGTNLPLVIVESCSMYHGQGFDDWWQDNYEWYEDNGISKSSFKDFIVDNGFNKGDIFLVLGASEENVEVGDVIIFASGISQKPIIHRVVDLDPIQTKGDNNQRQFSSSNNPERIDETNISEEQLIGKITPIRVPYLGWAKLIFFEPFRSSSERGFCE